MEVDPGRKKALYELHKSTGDSHDLGDDDSVELFKEQWPSATLKEYTREVDSMALSGKNVELRRVVTMIKVMSSNDRSSLEDSVKT